MHSQQHPEPDQLDRLRAGLLDDQPEVKAALETHIAGCAVCRQRGNWQLLQPGTLAPELDPDALQQSLQNVRRQALQSASQQRHHGFVPWASAALLLLAVSIGFWMLQPDTGGQQQIAAQDPRVIPDIYEDLDFYLWLADQGDNGNADEDANPGNT